MEAKQLNVFAVVAKYENMSTAAKLLHIAQPAISQSIGRLEEELGVPLFDRVGKKIKLNRAGHHLQKSLPKMLDPYEKVKEELKELMTGPLQHIHLYVQSTSVIIPDLLKDYLSKVPHTRFTLTQNPGTTHYDLCITSIPLGAPVKEGIKVLEEQILLAIPTNNPLADKGNILLEDIHQAPYITLDGKSAFTQIINHYLNGEGILANVAFEVESPGMMRGLIESGLGVGFYPELTWGKLVNNQIKLRKISDAAMGRQIILIIPEEKKQDEGLKAFYDHVRDYYQGLPSLKS